MKTLSKIAAACCLLLMPFLGQSQTYFPPTTGTTWDTLPASNLGWCQDRIDSLYQFLEARNSKSFIVLKDGRRVLEKYFGTYERDSIWYWASAGKSLAAVMVGIAQEQGYLDINDPTSNYLGQGWTAMTPAQEQAITIRNQISMTTGMEWFIPNQNCLADSCLLYRTPPDSQWFYHNAPYRLVQDVVASATNASFNAYTFTELGSKIGMGGLWISYVRYGKARDMARFGLLCLNRGVWAGDTILGDTTYFHDMVNTSNVHNLSYGYLWWLNGKASHILPGLPFTFSGPIIPSAPADMYSALGKNDQKIYVVPSMDLVVVRQGNAADTATFALSGFDDQLWQMIGNLACATSAEEPEAFRFSLYPNPAGQQARLQWQDSGQVLPVELFGLDGQRKGTWLGEGGSLDLDLSALSPGMYFLRIETGEASRVLKFLKRDGGK